MPLRFSRYGTWRITLAGEAARYVDMRRYAIFAALMLYMLLLLMILRRCLMLRRLL